MAACSVMYGVQDKTIIGIVQECENKTHVAAAHGVLHVKGIISVNTNFAVAFSHYIIDDRNLVVVVLLSDF